MCCVMPPASRVGDIGRADGVEQRSFAVIDVAHDGDHRSARSRDPARSSASSTSQRRFFLEAERAGGCAEVAGDILGQFDVERLVDGGEDLAVDELLDDEAGLDAELLGQFLDGDAFADGDFAIDRRRTTDSSRGAAPCGQKLAFCIAASRSVRYARRPALALRRRCVSVGGGADSGWRRRGRDASAARGTHLRVHRDLRSRRAGHRGREPRAGRAARVRGKWLAGTGLDGRGAPGRAGAGVDRASRRAAAVCCRRATRSGRGGTTGRAAGCPARLAPDAARSARRTGCQVTRSGRWRPGRGRSAEPGRPEPWTAAAVRASRMAMAATAGAVRRDWPGLADAAGAGGAVSLGPCGPGLRGLRYAGREQPAAPVVPRPARWPDEGMDDDGGADRRRAIGATQRSASTQRRTQRGDRRPRRRACGSSGDGAAASGGAAAISGAGLGSAARAAASDACRGCGTARLVAATGAAGCSVSAGAIASLFIATATRDRRSRRIDRRMPKRRLIAVATSSSIELEWVFFS